MHRRIPPMESSLVERLEKLERQMRRWRTASLLLLAILVIALMASAAYSSSDGMIQLPATRLSAHSFVLVGTDGNVYARLASKEGRPVLEFYDNDGKVVWSA